MKENEQYLIFIYNQYYPDGGFYDLKLMLDDLDTLRGDIAEFDSYDIMQIVDMENGTIAKVDIYDFLKDDDYEINFEDL